MPAKPRINPNIALRGREVLDLTKIIITNQSGNVAPMIDPSPPEIYLSPQVESVLLKMKFRKVRLSMVIHSLPLGKALPLNVKKITYANPPMNCRMAASCKAGMCLTPSLDAIHVVPQRNDTRPSAIRAFVLVPFF